jgi:hypothetical protein
LVRSSCLSLLLSMLAVVACGGRQARSHPDPLAALPALLAPNAQPPSCQPMPDTLRVDVTAVGPFTLCTSPSFATLRDNDARTVWFTRNWHPGSHSAALAARDSLARLMVPRYGQPSSCADERMLWRLKGYFIELHVAPTSDVVRPDLDWYVELSGEAGASPDCARRAT